MNSRSILKRITALALAATMLAAAPSGSQQQPQAQAPAAPQAAADEQVQVEAKPLWGILVNIVISRIASAAFDTFLNWLAARITSGLDAGADRLLGSMFRDSGAKVAARTAPGDLAAPPVVVGNPSVPLKVEGGQSNYQGLHLAIAVQSPDGSFSVRPVDQGFRSGERFKLRILSTFDAELSLENVNPNGLRRQIYPADTGNVVKIVGGRQALVPLGENELLEFAGPTGREQLVVNLRDPRALGSAASPHKVHRQDRPNGSNFLQEVGPGTYPAISQAITLQHGK